MSVALGAALLAWLGASLICVSDGRRGMALGLLMVAAGFAGLLLVGGHVRSGIVVLAGGGLGGLLRLRDGVPGWGVFPAGSTPRILQAVVALLVAAFLGASVVSGPGGPARVATLAVILLGAAGMLSADRRGSALTAAAAFAIALGCTGGTFALGAGALAAAGFGLVGAVDAPRTAA